MLWFAGGILFGFAFDVRYQTILMFAGLCAWLLIIKRIYIGQLLFFICGMGVAVMAGVLIDWWGYGEMVFVPSSYVRQHLLEGISKKFGVEPFYAYLYLPLKNAMAPLTSLILIAGFITWIKYPVHILTWISLPFFLLHCFIAHKEVRFLFPISVFAGAFLVYGYFVNKKEKSFPGSKAGFAFRKKLSTVYIAGSFCAAVVAGIIPYRAADIMMYKYIYNHYPNCFEFYTVNYDPYQKYGLTMSFYMPETVKKHRVSSYEQLAAIAAQADTCIIATSYESKKLIPACCKNSALIYESISPKRRIYMYLEKKFSSIIKRSPFRWDGKIRRMYKICP